MRSSRKSSAFGKKIARRHDYDIDRIFQAAKERSAKRKKGKKEKELSERKAEGSA